MEAELEVLYEDKERLAEKRAAGSPQPSVLERDIQAVVPTCSPFSQPSASSLVLLLIMTISTCVHQCR